jgi:FAD/FMN-containing dehydrogenase
VTIDLRALNTVKVRDKNVVSVGAGSIWSDIYSQLEPLNLTVNGGRVAGIGVGGFLTGGKFWTFLIREQMLI